MEESILRFWFCVSERVKKCSKINYKRWIHAKNFQTCNINLKANILFGVQTWCEEYNLALTPSTFFLKSEHLPSIVSAWRKYINENINIRRMYELPCKMNSLVYQVVWRSFSELLEFLHLHSFYHWKAINGKAQFFCHLADFFRLALDDIHHFLMESHDKGWGLGWN